MTSPTRRRALRPHAYTNVVRKVGGERALDTVASRQATYVAGLVVTDDHHGVCPVCFRLVRLRTNGTLFNHHDYCTGGGESPAGSTP